MKLKTLEIFPRGVTCPFCLSSDVNLCKLGNIYEHKNITVHYFCLLLASQIKQEGADNEGILGFLPKDIKNEIVRGSKLFCVYCNKKGATVVCSYPSCCVKFHLNCGIKRNSMHLFMDSFESYCGKHRIYQKIPTLHQQKIIDPICSICFCKATLKNRADYIWPECCKPSSLLHRDCVQALALSSGYYFKCPLCNTNEKFWQQMKNLGIFVPEQEASWEMPNSFNDLLISKTCEEDVCLSPKGRDYNKNKSRWELISCGCCGGTARHLACAGFKNDFRKKKKWICTLCQTLKSKNNSFPTIQNTETIKNVLSDELVNNCSSGRPYLILHKLPDNIQPSFSYKIKYEDEKKLKFEIAKIESDYTTSQAPVDQEDQKFKIDKIESDYTTSQAPVDQEDQKFKIDKIESDYTTSQAPVDQEDQKFKIDKIESDYTTSQAPVGEDDFYKDDFFFPRCKIKDKNLKCSDELEHELSVKNILFRSTEDLGDNGLSSPTSRERLCESVIDFMRQDFKKTPERISAHIRNDYKTYNKTPVKTPPNTPILLKAESISRKLVHYHKTPTKVKPLSIQNSILKEVVSCHNVQNRLKRVNQTPIEDYSTPHKIARFPTGAKEEEIEKGIQPPVSSATCQAGSSTPKDIPRVNDTDNKEIHIYTISQQGGLGIYLGTSSIKNRDFNNSYFLCYDISDKPCQIYQITYIDKLPYTLVCKKKKICFSTVEKYNNLIFVAPCIKLMCKFKTNLENINKCLKRLNENRITVNVRKIYPTPINRKALLPYVTVNELSYFDGIQFGNYISTMIGCEQIIILTDESGSIYADLIRNHLPYPFKCTIICERDVCLKHHFTLFKKSKAFSAIFIISGIYKTFHEHVFFKDVLSFINNQNGKRIILSTLPLPKNSMVFQYRLTSNFNKKIIDFCAQYCINYWDLRNVEFKND